jgi:hypothetical protein
VYIYKVCNREIYRCHYAISCYHSNELSIVNMLHERTYWVTKQRAAFFLAHFTYFEKKLTKMKLMISFCCLFACLCVSLRLKLMRSPCCLCAPKFFFLFSMRSVSQEWECTLLVFPELLSRIQPYGPPWPVTGISLPLPLLSRIRWTQYIMNNYMILQYMQLLKRR